MIVDPRLSGGQEVAYTHIVQNGEVLIVPNNDLWRDAWNGSDQIESFFAYAMMGDSEWQKKPRPHAVPDKD